MAVDVDVFVPVRTPARPSWTVADGAYLIFLLLVFVGLAPFATRDPIALAAGERGSGAAGDLARQIAMQARSSSLPGLRCGQTVYAHCRAYRPLLRRCLCGAH